MPPSRTPMEWFDAILTEAELERMFDSEFSPNPHAPFAVADQMARSLGAAAVPVLLEKLDLYPSFATYVLREIGPEAGPAAADELEKRAGASTEAAVALWCVDEPRARELGLHRAEGARGEIASYLSYSADPARLAKMVVPLLADGDPDVVAFALGAGGYGDDSRIRSLISKNEALVPVATLRALVGHGDARVRIAAAELLGARQEPTDATTVLEQSLDDGSGSRHVRWLAPLADSDRLIEQLAPTPPAMFELVRRRRCAGLSTDVDRVRPHARAYLARRPGSTHRWELDVEYGARLVRETRDLALLPDVVAAACANPPYSPYQVAEQVILTFGEAGIAAVLDARARASGRAHEALGWVLEAMTRRWDIADRLRFADEIFAGGGKIEDGLLVDTSAYAYYADVLLRAPRSAHAAVQLAWIDRAFGSPIDDRRVEWLRDLGIEDDTLLGDLATAPMATLRADRSYYLAPLDRDDAERAAHLADVAERAGLPSVACFYWEKVGETAKAEEARARARAHVEWVRRISPPTEEATSPAASPATPAPHRPPAAPGDAPVRAVLSVEALARSPLCWKHAGDSEFAYRAEVEGRTLTVRVNDFPAEPLYTLLEGDQELGDLEDWPAAWVRP